MTDSFAVPAPAELERPRVPRWPRVAVTALFALFYAYDVWEAVGNLLLLPGFYTALELTVPWGLLIAALLLPVVSFVVAVIVGRRKPLGIAALILLLGLSVSAAYGLLFNALA